MAEGARKETIDDEDQFCNKQILQSILKSKDVFDYMFTNPKDKNGKCLVGDDSLLYFADVCAGPGGFSEYVLWRKKWRAKGFGFTIKGKNDFKLDDFFAGSPESFDTHYGEGGMER